MAVSATYTRIGTGPSSVGQLHATGFVDSYIAAPDSKSVSAGYGSFSIDLYFNSSGLLLNNPGNQLTAKTIGGTTLFASPRAYANAVVAAGPTLTLETLWEKPAGSASGTLASASPHPFIGSLVVLKGLQYTSGTPGSLAFSTSGNALLFKTVELGSANVYMVPLPAAGFGGLALLGIGVVRRKSHPLHSSTSPESSLN